ncbi:MAG: hypothetical protein HYZ85_01950 [Candidatus Omnitrophica bacterium]|nr:hypothetical protein [Candidatus Omnitrophota bacterium]
MPEPKTGNLMRRKEILKKGLLYHAVHGLCRIDRMIQQNHSGEKVLCYSLVPNIGNQMRIRFIIGTHDLEASGFHTLISIKEANEILDYFKTGASRAAQTHPAWTLAQNILSFSLEGAVSKDQRKRQVLKYSAKGLVGELAFVLKTTLKQASEKIQDNLRKTSKVNLVVTSALVEAADD